MEKKETKLVKALRKDFKELYVKEYTTGWREQRFIRNIELGIMSLKNTEKYISEELDKARREYFSMGMEYFSLIEDSNIYQKKGWKLSKEKAERLQILEKMFNLLKDNK